MCDVWSVRCVKTAMDGPLPPESPSPSPASPSAAWWPGHIATLFEQRIRRIVMVGAGGLKATRKPGPKLRKLLPEMPAETLAAEARRNLEILMLHDPAKVDGVAIHMQILNTTRAKTRSRDMGRAYKLSEVLPRVKTPLTGIWGEFDSTTYPHIQERIDLFRALQPDFEMNLIAGAGHWVAYEAAEAFNKRLLEVLKP
jgi:pimeloyl-ACP methyl ester carboxylesterase